jgi:predicted DNA-binding transcriptional regulator AlpA
MIDVKQAVREAQWNGQVDTQIAVIEAVVRGMIENGEIGGTEGGVVSLNEASRLLAGISTREIHRKCENGELDKVKLGSRASGVTRASIRNYIRRNKVKPGKSNGQRGCEES